MNSYRDTLDSVATSVFDNVSVINELGLRFQIVQFHFV